MRKTILLYLLVCVFLILVFSSCGVFISDDRALEAVEKAGFSKPVIISSYLFFLSYRGCAVESGDRAGFLIEATNPKNERVRFIVCVGYWKGATIRY